MYKQIDKIKQDLYNRGYDKDIPLDIFGKTLMVLFGMKKITAQNWIKNFETVDIIKVSNYKVNFT